VTASLPIWREPATLGRTSSAIPSHVDVAVIGAGVIGLAAAHHLLAAGANAVLVDAGQPGSGSSTTGGGVVGWSRATADPSEIDPRASGFRDVVETLAGSQTWFDGFLRSNDLGAELTIPGSVRITGPADPGPLGTVHPRRLIDALVDSISASGGAIAFDEPLRSASRHTGGFQLLTSERKISARDLIVATGAASGPYPLGELAKRYRIRHGRCLVVEIGSEVLDEVVPIGRTVHLPGDAITLTRRIGTTAALVWVPVLARRQTRLDAAALLKAVEPQLSGGTITHDWHDRYPTTLDGFPRIGRINAMWYAGGAADTALGALLGHHAAGLAIGTIGSSPFAEIPHEHALTARLRSRVIGSSRRFGRRRFSA
jgi:glycine/D-amino acid oxidase-like deaminating enzyme